MSKGLSIADLTRRGGVGIEGSSLNILTPQKVKGASAAKPMRPLKLSRKVFTLAGSIYHERYAFSFASSIKFSPYPCANLSRAVQNWRTYCFPFAFAALNFAHRAFVAFEIFALAAADNSRYIKSHKRLAHPGDKASSAAERNQMKKILTLYKTLSAGNKGRVLALL